MQFKNPVIVLSVCISFVIICMAIFDYVFDFLSKTLRVDANVLLIESWMPPQVYGMVYEEFENNGYDYILTTGIKSENEYFMISENGYLIFDVKNKKFTDTVTNGHIIEIDAYSELCRENSARFNLWINDSLVADFTATRSKKSYSFTWKGSLNNIDSIMVQFTNDEVGDFGDRNLYVKSVTIDKNKVIPYFNWSEYDIGCIDGQRRSVNNVQSNAESSRVSLSKLGIDSTLIKAVPGNNANIHRTLHSALAARDYLKTSDIEIKGMNIMSSDLHSTRTWMTFKKVFDNSFNIGIISLQIDNTASPLSRAPSVLTETIALIYYWIILIPY